MNSDNHDTIVELVTVEVKTDFTPPLVQQASSYKRFSDRVWIAVPIPVPGVDPADAAEAIRDHDRLLFDHVVDLGLGILACRRERGSAYRVFPVHWPRKLEPYPVEREAFLERYRAHLEEAQVLRPVSGARYPAIG